MSYPKERAEFLRIMAAEGLPADVCDEILHRAQRAQRYAVDACNRQLSPREQANDKRNDNAICELLGNYPGFSATIGGDPRGYIVKIRVPSGKTNDWGQEGIGVTVKG